MTKNMIPVSLGELLYKVNSMQNVEGKRNEE